ncbi:MAG: NAD-dependent epimerase/dehydratase family protein [Polyangiales bacterium]
MVLAAGEKVFVTGGSGFVGGRLIEQLRARGLVVRALARSAASESAVRARGAEPVTGDLDDESALRDGMRGCVAVFHAAAKVDEWGDPADFERINVEGTRRVMDSARGSGVTRAVHVGTEAALLDGSPLVDVDEKRPLPMRAIGLYADSKRRAEQAATAASRDGLDVMIVRPRFIWGEGDTSVLANIVERTRKGKFAWIGGGMHLTSTCHVDNVCEGTILAAERGTPGSAYFLTDGAPVRFRPFLSAMLRSRGVEPPDATVPFGVAMAAARVTEATWKLFGVRSAPPVTRMAVLLSGQTVTVRDDRARSELGYASKVSVEAGLRAMGYAGPYDFA